MGFRYRKSINLGGGARISLSKSGIGASMGAKGFRVTKKAGGGIRTTASIPGTGISYVSESGKRTAAAQSAAGAPNYRFFSFMLRALSIPLIGLGALIALIEPSAGLLSIAGGAACWMAATHYKKLHKQGQAQIKAIGNL